MSTQLSKSDRPGRLGDPDMSLSTDPRTNPQLLRTLEQFGMDVNAEAAPVSADSSYEDCLAFTVEMEAGYEAIYGPLHQNLPDLDVAREARTILGVDGNDIKLHIHKPKVVSSDLPCIVHLHGGAMVFLTADGVNYIRWRDELAARGALVIGVEFRNGGGVLGDHPFPAGLNDCATAIRWVATNKSTLDVSHIVVTGESGGGNLSLATALKAREEGWIKDISGVYAMCPYISGQYATPPPELLSLKENDGYTVGVAMLGALAKVYDPSGVDWDNPLAWPYRSSLSYLEGLPPHYISVNELDPLRDEGLAYYRKLQAAGVSAHCRVVEGTCHAGDCISPLVIPDLYQSTLNSISQFVRSLADSE